MSCSPTRQKISLPLDYHSHRATHLVVLHILGPDQFRFPIGTDQIDLGMPIAEHMHMGRFMVIAKNDDAQAMRPIDRNYDLR